MSLLSSVEPIGPSPLDEWRALQGDLTAVERFAQRHESVSEPLQARYYRDLVPVTAPGPGEQYAFEVDLDACTGCKACVAACHGLNGLDADESWRTVSVLTGTSDGESLRQTVTAACHHCADPACLRGCPVDAYEKDPATGIVVHLDDQCIGCSYCTLTCPYEVPRFSRAHGIVRKCDLCRGRLTAGEAPGCVQACPNGAIAVRLVPVAAARATTAPLVPGTAPSSVTAPTTRYRSRGDRVARLVPDAAASSGAAAAHPPLAVMLVLTQIAVGAFMADLLTRRSVSSGLPLADMLLILTVAAVALGASVFHLGRPERAYRAVLGVGHSWLSREIVAFGAFTGAAVAYAVGTATGAVSAGSGASRVLGGAVAATGLAGVVCSIAIYVGTRRATWEAVPVSVRFGGTTASGGLLLVAWVGAIGAVWDGAAPSVTGILLAAAAVAALKLGAELVLDAVPGPPAERARRAALRRGPLRPAVRRRVGLGVVAGVLLPVVAALPAVPAAVRAALVTVALAGLIVAELTERRLFFTGVGAVR